MENQARKQAGQVKAWQKVARHNNQSSKQPGHNVVRNTYHDDDNAHVIIDKALSSLNKKTLILVAFDKGKNETITIIVMLTTVAMIVMFVVLKPGIVEYVMAELLLVMMTTLR